MAILQTLAVLAGLGTDDSIGGVVFDASIKENHTASATITKHKVESGSVISDHISKDPDSVTINGVVSNTSITYPQALPGFPVAQALANAITLSDDPVHKAYNALYALVGSPTTVEIVTQLRTYKDMAISSFTVDQDASSANALFFTMTAIQAKIVNTVGEVAAAVTTASAAAKKPLGTKPKTPAPAATQTKSVGLLRSFTNLAKQ